MKSLNIDASERANLDSLTEIQLKTIAEEFEFHPEEVDLSKEDFNQT